MSGLKALALDHYFSQDLDALEQTGRIVLRRIPFEALRQPALRFLGHDVTRDLHSFNDPSLVQARQRYAEWLSGRIRKLYLQWPFDVVVLPSDIFFYVRALPAAVHAIGIPVVVVQKETTISPDTLERDSQIVRDEAPFISDHMTVNSVRQREFWLRADAEPERIEITGQPRFDFYADVTPPPERRTVLFLSYELDAYEPGVGGGMGRLTWKPLRDETEAVLFKLAREGVIDLVVKLHPQQTRSGELERLGAAAESLWGGAITVADPEADTRYLIRDASAVVGFQTTAMYEAVAASRQTIYAAWSSEYLSARDALIPFHEAPPECVGHARSPAELEDLLRTPPQPSESCRKWAEDALGPLDGLAAQRVIDTLERIVSEISPRLPGRPRHSPARTLGWLAGVAAGELVLRLALPLARVLGKMEGARYHIARRREDRALALQALTRGG